MAGRFGQNGEKPTSVLTGAHVRNAADPVDALFNDDVGTERAEAGVCVPGHARWLPRVEHKIAVETFNVVRLASVKESRVGKLGWKRVSACPAVEADPTVVQESFVGRIRPLIFFYDSFLK